MIVGNNQLLMGYRLIRGLLMGLVFLTVAGSACRQAPDLLLFGSMNTSRTIDDPASGRWAERMQVEGLPNLYKVSGDLYRGAQPAPEGLRELKKLGIRTVVNLRESNDDQARLAELGLAYEYIPMTAFFLKDENVVRFLKIVGNPGHTPIFVHCQRGADRTGLMCAIYRIALQGWSKDEAIAEMTQGGFRFNHGYQNVVNYIQDMDVSQIKQRAGLTPERVGSH
jgi:protein tyrosine/serine phosphatase